jgi:hypothetical protein
MLGLVVFGIDGWNDDPREIHTIGQRQLFLSTGDNYFFPVDWVNSFICLVLWLPPFGGTESLAR